MSITTGPQTHSSLYSPLKNIVIILFCVLGLYILSTTNYLIYHTAIEAVRIFIIFLYAFVLWKRRGDLDNDYLFILGIILPSVAILIALHTLSFKGMNVFREFDADLPTQLWIAERYIIGLTVLIAPIFLKRQSRTGKHLNVYAIFAVMAVIILLVLTSLFYWHNFPSCFIEGRGQTLFKILSEYVIIITLFISIALIESQRQRFDPRILRSLILFLFFNAIAELAFTTYINVYGLGSFLGHISLIVSYLFLLKVTLIINQTIT